MFESTASFLATSNTHRRVFVLLLILLAGSATGAAVAATPYEFSRTVADLNYASERMARELNDSPGYGSLRAAAWRLSNDAEQLQDSIDHGRSHAYIRIQISDVRRGYQQLQVAVAKSRGEGASELIAQHMATISALYNDMSAEHFYSSPDYGVASLYSPFQYTSPIIILPNNDGDVDLTNPYLPAELQRWIDAGQTLRPQTATELRNTQRAVSERTDIEQGFDHRSNVLDRATVRRWSTSPDN